MDKNQYAYRVYKSTITDSIYGGTVMADTMENAAKMIVKRCGISVIHEIENFHESHYFMLKNEEVGILIYLNPELL